MKKHWSMVAVFVGLLTLGVGANAADVYWNVNGEGGWLNPKQWIGETLPVANDTVRFPAGAVVNVDDALLAQLPSVSYVPEDGARVVFTISGDATLNGSLYGNGHVLKFGSGSLDMASGISFSGMLLVSNGTLRVCNWNDRISDKAWPYVDVGPNGTLKVGAHSKSSKFFYLQGLRGAGSVVKDNSISDLRIQFLGDRKAAVSPTCDFSGTVTGLSLAIGTSVSSMTETLYGKPVNQYFTDPAMPTMMPERFYYGTYGFMTVDGAGQTANMFGGPLATPEESVLKYLGTGGTSQNKIYLYNSGRGLVGVLDGGDHGGLVQAGSIENNPSGNGAAEGVVVRMVFAGDGSEACELTSALKDEKAANAMAVFKRGAGTWRFSNADNGNKGPVSVLQGRLEFDSIAAAGTKCSLGTASMLSTNYDGVAESCAVPWACKLGDGRTDPELTDLATLAYAGAAVAACSTRPVAIDGAGRVTDGGNGSIVFENAYGVADGTNTLVLGGTRDNSYVALTNGVGRLRVVKEGPGTWTLDRPTALAGGAYAKEGTLKLQAKKYSWYRFVVRQNWGVALGDANKNGTTMTGFGLWDDEGNILNPNLVHNLDCDAATAGLQPGQYAMTLPNAGGGRYEWSRPERSCDNLFSYAPNEYQDIHGGELAQFKRYIGSSDYSVPTLADEKTWIGFVIRLPEGKKPAATYDIRSYWGSNNMGAANFGLEPMAWSLEGSADGVNWFDLHVVSSNETPVTASQRWFSNDGEHHGGYPIASQTPGVCEVASVGAAQGATVETNDQTVPVDCIECETSLGCGTLKGFAFAESGTLKVSGNVRQLCGAGAFYAFTGDCKGLENLEDWTIVENGKVKANYRLSKTADGVVVVPPGMAIIVR